MNKEVKHYKDINDFFKLMGLPLLKRDDFYIVRYDEHDFVKDNPQEAYYHDYFEVSLAIGYDAHVAINEERKSVADFNLWFVSPGQIFTWEDGPSEETSQDAIGYGLFFKPEFLSFAPSVYNIYQKFPFFKNSTPSNFQLTDRQKKLFYEQFEAIKLEYAVDSEDSFEIIKALLSILLFTAKKELELGSRPGYFKSRDQEITYNFEDLIRQTVHKRQSIKFYAEQLNVSAIYLSECVKKATGKTAKKIIDEYLTLEAKSVLKQSTKSISEVALSLGFDDDSNFVKYFKKQTGITPRQYKSGGM